MASSHDRSLGETCGVPQCLPLPGVGSLSSRGATRVEAAQRGATEATWDTEANAQDDMHQDHRRHGSPMAQYRAGSCRAPATRPKPALHPHYTRTTPTLHPHYTHTGLAPATMPSAAPVIAAPMVSSHFASYRQRRRAGVAPRLRRTATELAALEQKQPEERMAEENVAVRSHRKVLKRKEHAHAAVAEQVQPSTRWRRQMSTSSCCPTAGRSASERGRLEFHHSVEQRMTIVPIALREHTKTTPYTRDYHSQNSKASLDRCSVGKMLCSRHSDSRVRPRWRVPCITATRNAGTG